MKKEHKNYLKSAILWIKNQKIVIEQAQFTTDYNQKMIDIHTRALELGKETLKAEMSTTDAFYSQMLEYCEENGIKKEKFTSKL